MKAAMKQLTEITAVAHLSCARKCNAPLADSITGMHEWEKHVPMSLTDHQAC